MSVGEILGQPKKAAPVSHPGEPAGDGEPGAPRARRRLAGRVAPAADAPPAEEAAAPGGRFRWSNTLAAECEAALWLDTPEAERARAYLLEDRKLAKESVKAFGLGLYVLDGQPVVNQAGRPYLAIPLLDRQRRIVNVRFRSIPVVGTCTNCESPTGCSKCKEYRVCSGRPLPLFGAGNLTSDRAVPVLVTEGELDVVAMHTYGFTVNVVSGTAGAGTWAEEWLEELEPYDGIVGLYDADEKGTEGWAKAAEKLGTYRCARAILPAKDANDCLVKGIDTEIIERAVKQASPMHGIELRQVDFFADRIEELIQHPERLRGTDTGSRKLNQALGGYRPGVVVISGETAHGKTTFTTWAMLTQARLGVGVMLTSFEQHPIGTVQKLLRVQVQKDFTRVDELARREAMAALGQLPLYILDHYGNIAPNKLVEVMRYAKRRLGIKHFLIDHLGFLIDPDTKDERLAIQAVMRALAVVAKQMEITIFLVAHPANTPKTAPGKWARVGMNDLKGASAIRQDADDIIIVTRENPNVQKGAKVNRPWPQARLFLDKVRSEFGTSGSEVALPFDAGACTYADEWDETPAGKAGLLVPRESPAVAPKASVPDGTPRRRRSRKAAEGPPPGPRPDGDGTGDAPDDPGA
jgi:KaiC/GvpD/RAD55 family RecA-like ATPase